MHGFVVNTLLAIKEDYVIDILQEFSTATATMKL
jgi:hypothetical protein